MWCREFLESILISTQALIMFVQDQSVWERGEVCLTWPGEYSSLLLASHTHVSYRNMLRMKCFNTILTATLCYSHRDSSRPTQYESKELWGKQIDTCQFPALCQIDLQKLLSLGLPFRKTEVPNHKSYSWKDQHKLSSSRKLPKPCPGLTGPSPGPLLSCCSTAW